MSQKTDSMIKLALVFFVSLLSFAVGTYVGKKYSDNQHKLALLEPKKDTPAPVASEFATEGKEDEKMDVADLAMSGSDQKPAALTDSEVAKIAEEFAAEEDSAEEKMVGTIQPDEKDVKTITDTAKPVVAAAQPATKAAVDKIKQMATAEERVPASIPTAKTEVAPLHFTVQIGSYPTEDEAQKMTQALQNKGYKTTFVPAKINGQMWYRVNVGLFGSVKEAQDYKKEFLEKTKLSSAIVQRVQQ